MNSAGGGGKLAERTDGVRNTPELSDLTHLNAQGRARMVDVTEKTATHRMAAAVGTVCMSPTTIERIREGSLPKGDVLAAAQTAGILAAKRTWELIPMCHILPLTSADMGFEILSDRVVIRAAIRCVGVTGVEMEALTAVSVAALTVYDMCKAIQKDIRIDGIRLLEKHGGKSGDYQASEQITGGE